MNFNNEKAGFVFKRMIIDRFINKYLRKTSACEFIMLQFFAITNLPLAILTNHLFWNKLHSENNFIDQEPTAVFNSHNEVFIVTDL